MPYNVQIKSKGGTPDNPQAYYAKAWGDTASETNELSAYTREPIKEQNGYSPAHVDVPERKIPWLVRLLFGK